MKQTRFSVLSLSVLMLVLCAPQSQSFGQTQRQQRPERSPFEEWDKNSDGYLSPQEFPSRFAQSLFKRIDADQDGRISRAEDDAYRAKKGKNGGNAPQLPQGTRVDRDVVYATAGKRELHLDLYRPQSAKQPTPLVIWIHGGGWRNGSKSGGGAAINLLVRGYAVAAVEYRLSGEAIFPAAIEDCKAAVSFLRLHAEKYNIDPQKFGVWGSSAGGHLVALLGTTNDVREFDRHPITKQASPRVQAVCDWFGPTDFLRMNDFPGRIDHDAQNSPESRFIGGAIQDHKQQVQRANPITYVSKSAPPFLIMHGEVDQAVPYNQSELLHAALVKAGASSTLHKVEKGDHGFRGATASRETLIKRSMDFFDATFK